MVAAPFEPAGIRVLAATLILALGQPVVAAAQGSSQSGVRCADGFVAATAAICRASHGGVAIVVTKSTGAASPKLLDAHYTAETFQSACVVSAGKPISGCPSDTTKKPISVTKTTGQASPQILNAAVNSENIQPAPGGTPKTVNPSVSKVLLDTAVKR
jgi:hypothetical protein